MPGFAGHRAVVFSSSSTLLIAFIKENNYINTNKSPPERDCRPFEKAIACGALQGVKAVGVPKTSAARKPSDPDPTPSQKPPREP